MIDFDVITGPNPSEQPRKPKAAPKKDPQRELTDRADAAAQAIASKQTVVVPQTGP